MPVATESGGNSGILATSHNSSSICPGLTGLGLAELLTQISEKLEILPLFLNGSIFPIPPFFCHFL